MTGIMGDGLGSWNYGKINNYTFFFPIAFASISTSLSSLLLDILVSALNELFEWIFKNSKVVDCLAYATIEL